METAAPAHEWRATADEIWAMIRASEQRLKEMERRHEEIDRILQETAQMQKENNRQIGGLSNRFGEVMENMIVPGLVEKFRELGFEVTRAGRNVEISDKVHGIYAELDAFLEDGDKVVAVEIKTKPNADDVNDHVKRMEKLRRYADLKGDRRTYLGAIAGAVFDKTVATHALKSGFYVIEPSGDTFRITEPSGEYHPREW